jgi:glycosyltransferase involved in cell wall biosynthesis
MSAVVIDVTRLLGRLMDDRLPTGIDRVSLAYIEHYMAGSRALVRHGTKSGLFSESVSARLFDFLLRWPPAGRARAHWLAWQGLISCLGNGDGHRGFMFNTGHNGLEDSHAARVVRWHNVRPLFMLHDLIPVLHPEFCRRGETERHEARLRNMLSLGHGIIVNSQATRDDLCRYAEQHALAVPPVVVAPLAPATRLKLTPLAVPAGFEARPYFVVVGTVEPRKNYLMLLQAWQRLVQTHGNATPHLVIIGQRGWDTENIEDLIERRPTLREHVTALQRCTDDQLSAWLQHARALLFPSFAEGYGLPVVEALAAGVPVIASDLPVLRQIAGDLPDFLDPLDTLAWIARIDDYASEDSAARAAQMQRMEGFRPPCWAEHFERVDDFIARLHVAAA